MQGVKSHDLTLSALNVVFSPKNIAFYEDAVATLSGAILTRFERRSIPSAQLILDPPACTPLSRVCTVSSLISL